MDDKISIEIENLCIEGSEAALTALIGAIQGRPTIDVDRIAEEITRDQRALVKKLIEQAKREISEESKQCKEKGHLLTVEITGADEIITKVEKLNDAIGDVKELCDDLSHNEIGYEIKTQS